MALEDSPVDLQAIWRILMAAPSGVLMLIIFLFLLIVVGVVLAISPRVMERRSIRKVDTLVATKDILGIVEAFQDERPAVHSAAERAILGLSDPRCLRPLYSYARARSATTHSIMDTFDDHARAESAIKTV